MAGKRDVTDGTLSRTLQREFSEWGSASVVSPLAEEDWDAVAALSWLGIVYVRVTVNGFDIYPVCRDKGSSYDRTCGFKIAASVNEGQSKTEALHSALKSLRYGVVATSSRDVSAVESLGQHALLATRYVGDGYGRFDDGKYILFVFRIE